MPLKPPDHSSSCGAQRNSVNSTAHTASVSTAEGGGISSTGIVDKSFAKTVDAQLASDSAHYQITRQQGQWPPVSNNPFSMSPNMLTDRPAGYGQLGIQGIQQAQSPPKAPEIDATLAERGSRYGSFTTHAFITQQLKRVMAGSPKWGELNPDQAEALEMIVHKIGRILNGDPHYHDSWHDIVGYAKLVADRLANGK